jgi:hypothetical protein
MRLRRVPDWQGGSLALLLRRLRGVPVLKKQALPTFELKNCPVGADGKKGEKALFYHNWRVSIEYHPGEKDLIVGQCTKCEKVEKHEPAQLSTPEDTEP